MSILTSYVVGNNTRKQVVYIKRDIVYIQLTKNAILYKAFYNKKISRDSNITNSNRHV